MKKILFLALFFLTASYSAVGNPDVSGDNYIISRHYTAEKGADYLEKKQFFNGLGDMEQIVNSGITPNRKSLVYLSEYDLANREIRQWLPVKMDNSQYMQPSQLKAAAIGMNNYGDTAPYTETVYHSGSSDRLKFRYKPGEVFRQTQKRQSYSYETNMDIEEPVMYFSLDLNDSVIIKSRYYAEDELKKECAWNEDGSVTMNYTDIYGRMVLQRTFPEETDTYYVYDNLDRIRLVISPEGVPHFLEMSGSVNPSSDVVRKYCYYYQYDKYGHLFFKQMPGADREYFIYGGDKLMYWQDGNLRPKKQWIRNFYNCQGQLTGQKLLAINKYPHEILNSVYAGSSDPDGFTTAVRTLSSAIYSPYIFPTCAPNPLNTYLCFLDVEGVVGQSDVKNLAGVKIYEECAILSDEQAPGTVERAFYYDDKGRVIQTVEKNQLGGTNRISYRYDFTGNILTKYETTQCGPDAIPENLVTDYTYDHAKRLKSEESRLNGGSAGVVTYLYDELGRLTTKNYGSGAEAISETYTYNIQNWETSRVNNYFDMQLRYYNPSMGTNACYAGNISEWQWKHKGPDSQFSDTFVYTFTYDALSRLNHSHRYVNGVADNGNTEQDIRYDRNGNILALTRYGNAGQLTDKLTLTYSGNYLAPASMLNPQRGYIYDANGNMTFDDYNFTNLSYNYLNLVEKVSSGDVTQANYRYLWDGTKLSATDAGGNGYEYLGSLEYKRTGSSLSLSSASFGGGRIVVSNSVSALPGDLPGKGEIVVIPPSRGDLSDVEARPVKGELVAAPPSLGDLSATRLPGVEVEAGGLPVLNQKRTYTPYYYLADHLGSVRVIVDNKGNVKERNDYYAFGQRWNNPSGVVSENKFLYNGKESQEMFGLGWLDYGARMYDPEIPRWLTKDPLAENYYSTSPYAYVRNNPVNRIDPNGMWEDDYRLNNDGRVELIKPTNDRYDTLTAEDEKGKEQKIKVYDRSILPSLMREGIDGYSGSFAETSNKSDAFNVFYMGAKYSNVEWSLNGYKTQTGNSFVLSTQHSTTNNVAYMGTHNPLTQIFDLHSHPGVNGMKGASGYYNGNSTTGDEAAILNKYYKFRDAGMSSTSTWFKSEVGNTKFPSHYVYHRMSSSLYHYTLWEQSIYIRPVNSGSDLYRNLGL